MATWILPCNIKYYDVAGAFANLDRVDWKQSSPAVKEGELAYIYIGLPVQEVCYKCVVTKTNLDVREIDDTPYILNGERYASFGRYMELKLLCEYKNHEITREIMQKNGLICRIQRQIRANPSLEEFLLSK